MESVSGSRSSCVGVANETRPQQCTVETLSYAATPRSSLLAVVAEILFRVTLVARCPATAFSAAQRKSNYEDQANAVGREGDIGGQAGRNMEDEGDDLGVGFDLELRQGHANGIWKLNLTVCAPGSSCTPRMM